MTQTQKQVLTDEQAARMTAETAESMELAKQQLIEYRTALIKELLDIDPFSYGLSVAQWSRLIDQAGLITFEMVRVEPSMKEDEKQTISVVYSFEDELHAFLHRPDFESRFNLANADKGITLEDAQ